MALTQSQAAARLRQLLAVPGNNCCADCPTRRPKWASTNLGVFICLRCSGCHRGLGVHISRVRSVTLDTWTETDLDHMAIVGNQRANAEWMANAPGGLKLPTNESSMEELQGFIIRKYKHKEWFSPSAPARKSPTSGHAAAAPTLPPELPVKPTILSDDGDPFAMSCPAGTSAMSFDNPFGEQPFDGRSPQQDVGAPSLLDQISNTVEAFGTRKQEGHNPFGSVALSPARGFQGGPSGGYDVTDPFGEGTTESGGGGGSTPAWVGTGTTTGPPVDAAITVRFAAGEPLGLGLAARAAFNPAVGNALASLVSVHLERRESTFDAYSTAVVRLNSSSSAAAAAGLEPGWIVGKLHGTDLRAVNHSDVLKRIRKALAADADQEQCSWTSDMGFTIEFWRPVEVPVEQARRQVPTSVPESSDSTARHVKVSKGWLLESPRARVRPTTPVMPVTPPPLISAGSQSSALRAASDAELEAEARRRGFSITRLPNSQLQPELHRDELDAFFG